MTKKKISVVIPSYNEMANLQKGTIQKVKNYLDDQKYEYELLIVDDGSSDGSREFVRELSKKYPKIHLIESAHTGKAGAVTTGMLKAQGDLILFTDMDQATPIEEIKKFTPEFEKGFDIVIGSRRERRGAPFTRKVMSQSMITLRKIIVGITGIHDTQCGFKMFTKESSHKIFTKLKEVRKGFKTIKGSSVTASFDVELLYIAEQYGYKIKEVPVTWLYVETRRVSPVKDSIEGLLGLFQVRKQIISGTYSS